MEEITNQYGGSSLINLTGNRETLMESELVELKK